MHGSQIQSCVAAGHVDGCAGASRGSHIDKLRLSGAIPGGIDMGDVGAHMLVHPDCPPFICLHTDGGEIQILDIRMAASGDQQPVAGNNARLCIQAELPAQEESPLAETHGVRLSVGEDAHPLLFKGRLERRSDIRVFMEE
jgi:hypothetical protein